MLMVKPMPNELGIAHAGRVAYVNGFSGLVQLRERTIGKARNHLSRKDFEHQFKVLAKKLDIDPETYLANHSLIPFLYACPRRGKETYTYQEHIATWLKPADGAILKHLRFCPECVREDELRTGISWWRREHQLPGVDICIHHKASLFRALGEEATGKLPRHYASSRRCVEEARPDSNASIVARYRTFAVALLGQRVELSHLRHRIRQRCIELAITRNLKSPTHEASLSQHVRSKFPSDWLQQHYPTLLRSDYIGRDLRIDAAFWGQGTSGPAFAMILASLFDSIDDLAREQDMPQLVIRSGDNTSSVNPRRSASSFARVFVAAQGNCRHVARAIGCEYHTAIRLRRRLGFPVVPRLQTPAHRVAFQRMLAASDSELARWGAEMQYYWKTHPNKGQGGADLLEFLRITAPDRSTH